MQWLGPLLLATLMLGASPSGAMQDEALIKALRAGGYSIYFRHAATDWSHSDQVSGRGDWTSCDAQRMRQLADAGRQTALAIGSAIRNLDIPVSEVLASPYCRTVETAELMALGPVQSSTAVINLRIADYFGGRSSVIASAQALLGSAPRSPGNRVIVAHGNVAREATPVYPGEAEAVIFAPDGEGGFTVVARVTPADWQRLAGQWGRRP